MSQVMHQLCSTKTWWNIRVTCCHGQVKESQIPSSLSQWQANSEHPFHSSRKQGHCIREEATTAFSALLALVVAAYYWTNISRTMLFWAAFILTRSLGAVIGDFLDKPISSGGLALSRYSASAVLLAFTLTYILIFQQRAAKQCHW